MSCLGFPQAFLVARPLRLQTLCQAYWIVRLHFWLEHKNSYTDEKCNDPRGGR